MPVPLAEDAYRQVIWGGRGAGMFTMSRPVPSLSKQAAEEGIDQGIVENENQDHSMIESEAACLP